jgi:hypothetical protein
VMGFYYAARLADLEYGKARPEAAEIELSADLILFRLERCEHSVRVGGTRRRRRPRRKTFDVVDVERQPRATISQTP